MKKLPHGEENFFKENSKKFFDDWEIREYVELQSLGKKKKKWEKWKDKTNYENGIRKREAMKKYKVSNI